MMNDRDSNGCQDLSHQKSSTVIFKRARRNNNTTRYYRRKSNAIERGLSRRSHNLWIRRGLHHSISTNQSRDYPTTPPQGRLVRSSTDQRYIVQLYRLQNDKTWSLKDRSAQLQQRLQQMDNLRNIKPG